MKTLLTSIMFILVSASAALAADVAVEQVGFTGLRQNLKPILTIKIGNPVLGEMAAENNGGVDGMLWTPVHDSDRWILGNHRSPKRAEAETGNRRAVVRSTYTVGPPPMLANLDLELLALVEYVMVYEEGGTRIMLRPGTSQIDVGIIATAISEHLWRLTDGPNP